MTHADNTILFIIIREKILNGTHYSIESGNLFRIFMTQIGYIMVEFFRRKKLYPILHTKQGRGNLQLRSRVESVGGKLLRNTSDAKVILTKFMKYDFC